MKKFLMNGYLWHVRTVEPDHPMLVDRTNTRRVATTDPQSMSIYVSSRISGHFRTTVIIHELGHCALFSYGLIDDLHDMVYPEYWVEAEEWVCNFIADYGMAIFNAAYHILGDEAIMSVPYEIERLIA